jgi:hypothetical protein
MHNWRYLENAIVTTSQDPPGDLSAMTATPTAHAVPGTSGVLTSGNYAFSADFPHNGDAYFYRMSLADNKVQTVWLQLAHGDTFESMYTDWCVTDEDTMLAVVFSSAGTSLDSTARVIKISFATTVNSSASNSPSPSPSTGPSSSLSPSAPVQPATITTLATWTVTSDPSSAPYTPGVMEPWWFVVLKNTVGEWVVAWDAVTKRATIATGSGNYYMSSFRVHTYNLSTDTHTISPETYLHADPAAGTDDGSANQVNVRIYGSNLLIWYGGVTNQMPAWLQLELYGESPHNGLVEEANTLSLFTYDVSSPGSVRRIVTFSNNSGGQTPELYDGEVDYVSGSVYIWGDYLFNESGDPAFALTHHRIVVVSFSTAGGNGAGVTVYLTPLDANGTVLPFTPFISSHQRGLTMLSSDKTIRNAAFSVLGHYTGYSFSARRFSPTLDDVDSRVWSDRGGGLIAGDSLRGLATRTVTASGIPNTGIGNLSVQGTRLVLGHDVYL